MNFVLKLFVSILMIFFFNKFYKNYSSNCIFNFQLLKNEWRLKINYVIVTEIISVKLANKANKQKK